MPKIKSHSGAKKRFKATASGKFLHGKAGKRHLLTNKATGRKKTLRGTEVANDSFDTHLKRMLPYS